MRAAIYARVSTEEQAHRYGIGGQLERLQERAQVRGYAVAGEFVDDGWSGGSLERPALARLREAVAQGLVDAVLAYDPDRLARDLADLLFLDKEFQRAGVRLETITTEIDGSPEGRMFFQFKGAFAEYERAIIRRRTIEGRRSKAREGKLVNPRCLPRWLRYDRETGRVELDQEWAQVLRLAYRVVDEEGLNLRALARRFHELGIPSPQGGTHWRASTLREWLRSTAAKGDYYQLRYEHVEAKRPLKALPQRRKSSYRLRPREEWQPVRVPAAVAPDLWERVQRRLDQNKALAARNTRREYLLQGLVRCGLCGRRMTGRYHTRDKKQFYRCQRSRELEHDIHGDACTQKLIRADCLEEAVWATIAGLLQEPETLRDELRRRREEGSPTKEAAEQELQAARKRLEAIPREQDRLVEGYGKGLIPDDRMRARMEALKAEREGLQRRVAELERQLTRLEVTQEQESQALAFAERVRDGLEHLDFAGRQQLLRLVVEDVTCYDGQAVIRTIIPTSGSGEMGQLCPPHREGDTGGEGFEMSSIKPIEWVQGKIRLLDQTRLPIEEVYLEIADCRELAGAIREMRIRGAPALGVAAGYGVALGAQAIEAREKKQFLKELEAVIETIRATRPTGVNLSWALERMSQVAREDRGVPEAKAALLEEARRIDRENEESDRRLSQLGADLIEDGATVLTHCNAGYLATAGYGTALGIIRAAREQGKSVRVFATETRPLLQGARLTAWELLRDGIDVTLIADAMVGHFMRKGTIDCVIVGADRIAANGDVANKIGTYSIAVLAMEHGVPFYVAAPMSTVDLSLASGEEIPIEERGPEEVTHIRGVQIAPNGVEAANPAFDVTPHYYIAAIITERGIVREPYADRLRRLGQIRNSA